MPQHDLSTLQNLSHDPTQPYVGKRVPARFIGGSSVTLSAHVTHYDGQGARRTSTTLRPGDTLLIPDHELFGHTLLWDTFDGELRPYYLGAGRVILPQHAEKSEAELAALGYEFQGGSANWEPYDPTADVETAADAAAAESPDEAAAAESAPAKPARASRASAVASPADVTETPAPAATETQSA